MSSSRNDGLLIATDPDRVDPELATILAAMPPPELTAATLDLLRASRVRQRPPSEHVERFDVEVDGLDPSAKVALRIQRPVHVRGLLPCIYWIHGGGYVMGRHTDEDVRLDRWCRTLSCVAVAVDYRLAPENPFPAALHDCVAGLRWIATNAAELGVDVRRLGIGGSSAGGGLAAALALTMRDHSDVEVAFAVLNYPMLDDRQTSASSHWSVPGWSAAANEFAWASYLGPIHRSRHVPPSAAPARASDLTGLPPTLIAIGTVDGFIDESFRYAERLNRAGVEVDLHVYVGAIHAFDALAPQSALARRYRLQTERWLTQQMASERPLRGSPPPASIPSRGTT